MNTGRFRSALHAGFAAGAARHAPFVDINARDLHHSVGGYPGNDHRMPLYCQVMKDECTPADQLLQTPPSGSGASLTIRYALPR
ncbi:MAG TPA: hypothetical protein V6D47_12955 [Oscillatoriaceae cyanobacterium]